MLFQSKRTAASKARARRVRAYILAWKQTDAFYEFDGFLRHRKWNDKILLGDPRASRDLCSLFRIAWLQHVISVIRLIS